MPLTSPLAADSLLPSGCRPGKATGTTSRSCRGQAGTSAPEALISCAGGDLPGAAGGSRERESLRVVCTAGVAVAVG